MAAWIVLTLAAGFVYEGCLRYGVAPYVHAANQARLDRLGAALQQQLRGVAAGQVQQRIAGFAAAHRVHVQWVDTEAGRVLQIDRPRWPVYRRPEFITFVLVGIFFYLPLLIWFFFRMRGYARREKSASRTAHTSLRVAAHEIRRPLQRLAFAVQSVEEPLRRHAPKLHSVMQQALEEMAEVVDEALWYARFSHGPPPLQPHHFCIASLARELVAPLREIYPDHEFLIQPGAATPAAFRADRKLLERAAANLLSNAVKYGGGKVLVSWQWTNDELLFTVHDNGPGIPVGQRQQMFEPFITRTGEAAARPHGGLGLAIVKEVCASHGGKARITESPLGGAAVILCLPLGGPVTPHGSG